MRLHRPGQVLAAAQAMAAQLADGPTFAHGITKTMLHREWSMDIERRHRSGGAGAGDMYGDRGFPPCLRGLRRQAAAGIQGRLNERSDRDWPARPAAAILAAPARLCERYRRPGEIIFLAGQIGWDAQGRFPEGLANQVGQALANIVTLLAQAGAGPQHLVRLTWYVTDLQAYRESRPPSAPRTVRPSAGIFRPCR